MNLLASTRVFRTKSKLLFLFSIYFTLPCRRRTYIEFLQVSSASFGRTEEPNNFFLFAASGFHDFENNCFRKKSFNNFCPFSSFWSAFYLFSLMRRPITHSWYLRKEQFNIFLGPKMTLRLRQRFLANFI